MDIEADKLQSTFEYDYTFDIPGNRLYLNIRPTISEASGRTSSYELYMNSRNNSDFDKIIIKDWVKNTSASVQTQAGLSTQTVKLSQPGEWVDGNQVGLTAGNIYARKALANGDTVVIKNNGFVGIGTDNPTSGLDIKSGGLTGVRIILDNTGTPTNHSEISFRSQATEMGKIRSSTGDGLNGDLDFVVASGGVGAQQMVIKSNGNVGIGAANPVSRLQVKGISTFGNNSSTQGSVMFTGDYVDTNNMLTVFGTEFSSASPMIGYGIRPAYGASGYVNTHTSSAINRSSIVVGGNGGFAESALRVYGDTMRTVPTNTSTTLNELMRVNYNGNVGIGTTNPNTLLHMASISPKITLQDTDATINVNGHNQSINFTDGANNLTGKLGFGTSSQVMYVQNGNSNGQIWFSSDTITGTATGVDMAINTNGNVGIGTTGPATRLDVEFTQNSLPADNGAVEGIVIRNNSTNANTPAGIKFESKFTGTATAGIYGTSKATNDVMDMHFWTEQTGTALGRATKMILTSDGNVGIGVTTPSSKLHVASFSADVMTVERTSSQNAHIRYLNTIDTMWAGISPSGNFGIGVGSNLDNGVTTALTVLQANNNVGIGTLAPSQKLDVIGNIRASGSFISGATTLTVPDYVFEKYYTGESTLKADYTFKSLEEIENFTKANGHLPGITSAKEIKEDGSYNLTQSTLNNLEKIEELYLHLIEVNKEKEALKNQVKEQGEIIKELQKQMQEVLKTNETTTK